VYSDCDPVLLNTLSLNTRVSLVSPDTPVSLVSPDTISHVFHVMHSCYINKILTTHTGMGEIDRCRYDAIFIMVDVSEVSCWV